MFTSVEGGRLKILLLSRYGRLGSSSRLRMLQYMEHFREHGVIIEHSPLLDDSYLVDLYANAGRRRFLPLAAAYLYRLRALAHCGRYDLLWIEKELFPALPAWAERFVSAMRIPYVVDYDDATFHYYDLHKNSMIRGLLGGKIDSVMRRAALVVAGNSYIADRARAAGARRVEVLETVVDLDRYRVPEEKRRGVFTIGWIGIPFTARYLFDIEEALAEVCAEGRARVVLVGSGGMAFKGFSPEVREWSEATEAYDIGSFDVGIMPLPDEEWERGKCGYKLIQYMACGKPVVASPVGVNSEIVTDGQNGFLAKTCSDWVRWLGCLRDDETMRERLGRCGRRLVEERYCTRVAAPRLLELLVSAARK